MVVSVVACIVVVVIVDSGGGGGGGGGSGSRSIVVFSGKVSLLVIIRPPLEVRTQRHSVYREHIFSSPSRGGYFIECFMYVQHQKNKCTLSYSYTAELKVSEFNTFSENKILISMI